MKNLKVLLVLAIPLMVSCKAIHLKECNSLDKGERLHLEMMIKRRIDSYYNSSGSDESLSKVVRARCMNDTLVEVITLSNQGVKSNFQFNSTGTIINTTHELPPIE